MVNGKSNGVFDPQGKATRAEIAAIIHRFLEYGK
ncbi:MAG: S-layer homology domain-containing protein [Oscillospiraceae bacterium]|nr:S-layer homology domain-containing protein [Oscillospiraceae bacterium]